MGSFSSDKKVSFESIESEFNETFGYVARDIAFLLEKKTGLNYTIALLVCCDCEMLTWHQGLKDYQVFTSLLPNTEPYKAAGKTLWEALRHGLAHNFRPKTIVTMNNEEWRFTISSQPNFPQMSVTKGQPHWVHINIRELAERVISKIAAYEKELRTRAGARSTFVRRVKEKHKTKRYAQVFQRR